MAGTWSSSSRPKRTTQNIVSFITKSRERWGRQGTLAKQKTKQLIGQVEEVNKEVASHVSPREWRKLEGSAAFGKLKGWLWRQSHVPGGWVRKLRSRLSR